MTKGSAIVQTGFEDTKVRWYLVKGEDEIEVETVAQTSQEECTNNHCEERVPISSGAREEGI